MRRPDVENGVGKGGGAAIVLHPIIRDEGDESASRSRLAEAVGLAAAIGLGVVHAEVVPVRRPRPATLFGTGVVERIADVVAADELVVIDGPVTPVQQRNLERAWKTKVIDRTGLILEIFGARARTREGRMQVELAALTYQRTRLVRSWTHLERQRGALGFVGGPGESQLEIDRRLIDARIAKLKRQLDQVQRTRGLHRRARRRVPTPVVALVGYTNAGKTTLFNRLGAAEAFANDMLFATLDPTMRGVSLPGGQRVILADTVGFISDLPTNLIAAFRATFEEVLAADLIVHVRDASHDQSERQRRDVEAVLAALARDAAAGASRENSTTASRENSTTASRENGAETGLPPSIEALNKVDLLDAEARERVAATARRNADVVAISALTGAGCDHLLARIAEHLAAGRATARLAVPLSDGESLAWLYQRGDVLAREDDETLAHVQVRLSPADLARFSRRVLDREPRQGVPRGGRGQSGA